MGGANTTITGTIHTSVGNILTDGRELDNIENGEPLASCLAKTTCNIKLAGLLIVSLVINTNTSHVSSHGNHRAREISP